MFDELKAQLDAELIRPEDGLYDETRRVWNAAIDRRPAAIAVCRSEADVAEAVRFAAKHDLAVSIRGGGHHVGGTAVGDRALMLDLSGMRRVEVDSAKRIATVEAGATLGDVDRETQKYGLAVPTGTVSKTGIAGLALNGGLGYLRRKYGLTCDQLVGARLVTAAGELVHVDQATHPDLLWALRGGGGNFGVVVSFEFRLYPVGPEVLAIDVMYDYKDFKNILENARDYGRQAPDEVTFNITATQLPPAPFLPAELHHRQVVVISGLYAGDPQEGLAAVQPLREWAEPIADHTAVIPYEALQQKLDPLVPDTVPVAGTSLYFAELDDDLIDRLLKKLDGAPTPAVLAQLWPLGGQMNRVPAGETAFAVRDAGYVLLLDTMAIGADMESCRTWTDSVYAEFLPDSLRRASYLNAIAPGSDISERAFADNYGRLQELKKQWDPENRFRHNHNVNPLS